MSASLQVADNGHVSDAMHIRRQAGEFSVSGVMRDTALSERAPPRCNGIADREVSRQGISRNPVAPIRDSQDTDRGLEDAEGISI